MLHGQSHTRLHNIWCGMNKRCNSTNENSREYKDYASRGIKVCDEWKDFMNFHNWAIENGYADGLTIERLDVNKGYSPENCTWITAPKQARNRRTTRYVEYNGRTCSLAELCECENVDYKLVHRRLKDGWSLEDALHKPTKGKSDLHQKCDALGVNYHSIYSRLAMGWTEEEAFSVPMGKIGANQTNYSH